MPEEKPPECHWKRAGSGLIPRNAPDHVGIGIKPTKAARLDVKSSKGVTAAIRAESNGLAVRAISSKSDALFAKGGPKRSGVVAEGKVWGVMATGGSNGKGGGVRGNASGDSPGVEGLSTTGEGVIGRSKRGRGVLGQSDVANGVRGESTSGVGVFGKSGDKAGVVGLSAFGIGVQGLATNQQGVHGQSTKAAGVHGQSNTGPGVIGESKNGTGVDGFSNAGTGVSGISDNGTGVFAETGSIVTAAVVGRNPNGTAVEGIGGFIAVHGSTTTGRGVFGETTSGAGVVGESRSGIAVLAIAETGDLFQCKTGGLGQTERFRVANNGDVFVNGKVVHSSDARLKTAVAPLDNVLEKLDQINGVSFLRCESAATRDGGHRQIGVVAQDVRPVFPELVMPWGSGDHLAVDYAGLAAVLIEAVKALRLEGAQLRRRLELLEGPLLRSSCATRGAATPRSPSRRRPVTGGPLESR